MHKGDTVIIPAELLSKSYGSLMEVLIHGATITIPTSLLVKDNPDSPTEFSSSPSEWKIGMRVKHQFSPQFGEGIIKDYKASNTSVTEYTSMGHYESDQPGMWKVEYENEGIWWTNPENLIYVGEAL